MFKFSKSSMEKLEGLHPKLIEFAHKLLELSPHDFKITEGVRTVETQSMYYSWGRTVFVKPDGTPIKKPITKCDGKIKKSKHQIKADGYGYAFDIAFVGKTLGEAYDENKFLDLWKSSEKLCKEYGIVWGGNWVKFRDMPHWQLGGK